MPQQKWETIADFEAFESNIAKFDCRKRKREKERELQVGQLWEALCNNGENEDELSGMIQLNKKRGRGEAQNTRGREENGRIQREDFASFCATENPFSVPSLQGTPADVQDDEVPFMRGRCGRGEESEELNRSAFEQLVACVDLFWRVLSDGTIFCCMIV